MSDGQQTGVAVREPLPTRRRSWTQKVKVGGKTLYLTCGEYDDGRLGEVFLDYPRASEPMRAMMSALAQVISINLQYGVPLADVLHSLRRQDFMPQGAVSGSPNVTEARSLVDYVCKELEAVYLKPRPAEVFGPEPPPAADAPVVERVAGYKSQSLIG